MKTFCVFSCFIKKFLYTRSSIYEKSRRASAGPPLPALWLPALRLFGPPPPSPLPSPAPAPPSMVASPQNFLFFLFFLFFLNLCCSTHGDEALVGRVTVNAIFLGILIAVSPFLFIFALSNITIRCCCEAPSQRARATRLLLAFLFCIY